MNCSKNYLFFNELYIIFFIAEKRVGPAYSGRGTKAISAHIYLGQFLASPALLDAGYGPKRTKFKKNAKTCNLSNFVILQIKKKAHKYFIIVNA